MREKQVSFIGIIETKKSGLNRNQVARLWGGNNFNWFSVDAINSAGGILNMWDEDFWDHVECFKGLRWSCLKGVIKESSFRCAICTVYRPHVREEKEQLW